MSLPDPILTAVNDMNHAIAAFALDGLNGRKTEILTVFLRQAATQGYAATTMRSIGLELNLKAPSIYSHFPAGKEEIITYALRWQGARFGRTVMDATRRIQDPVKFFETLVRSHCAMNLESRENGLWDMITSSDRIAKFLPEALREEMNVWLGVCARLYQACGEALGCSEAKIKGRQILALVDGVYSWAILEGGKSGKKCILDHAVSSCRAILFAG